MPDSLSLVWGHSVHFAKFPILQFSERYSFNNFYQISIKLHVKYHNHGLILAITLFGDLPKIKNFIALFFEIFVNTGPYGAGNFKMLLLQFSSNLNQTL